MTQLRKQYPKLDMPSGDSAVRLAAAQPQRLCFALTTQTLSADLRTKIAHASLAGILIAHPADASHPWV